MLGVGVTISLLDTGESPVETRAAESTPEGKRLQAKALWMRGRTQRELGQSDEACASYEQALSSYRKLRERLPQSQQLQLEMAEALHEVGSYYYQQGDFAQGSPRLEEGLGLYQLLLVNEPGNGLWLMAVGDLAQKLALAPTNRGRLVRIGDLLDVSANALQRAVALSPENGECQARLANTLGQLGEHLNKVTRIDEALQAYSNQQQLLQSLLQAESGRLELRWKLAVSLHHSGGINLGRGRSQVAREQLQRALSLLEPVKASDAGSSDWLSLRIQILTTLGLACMEQAETTEALLDFQKVWDLSQERPERLLANPHWTTSCRLAADQAGKLLSSLAAQEHKAGREQEARRAELSAALWQERVKTLGPP